MSGLSVSLSRHGVPPDAARFNIRLDDHDRLATPEAFAELFDDDLLSLAEDEGLDPTRLQSATHQVLVLLPVPDPADAEHLRTAWAFVRALCDAVPVVGILDRHARRWWSDASLRAISPASVLDPRREVSILFSPDVVSGFEHVAHTRGLRKFGRPDLILVDLSLGEALDAGHVLERVASRLALGARLQPGESVVVEGRRYLATRYESQVNGPELGLHNHALVLTPEA